MSPRPAPDLDQRRREVIATARALAEAGYWEAVTMRRLASELKVSQPVLYSVFESRQALIDAIALDGFAEIAEAMEAVPCKPMARMTAYLEFAAARPRIYEAMFSLPSGLHFAVEDTPEVMQRAFAGIADAFPDEDGTLAEVVWSSLHGLAMLEAAGRLGPSQPERRLILAHALLTGSHP